MVFGFRAEGQQAYAVDGQELAEFCSVLACFRPFLNSY